jgi:hypothetical protein
LFIQETTEAQEGNRTPDLRITSESARDVLFKFDMTKSPFSSNYSEARDKFLQSA